MTRLAGDSVGCTASLCSHVTFNVGCLLVRLGAVYSHDSCRVGKYTQVCGQKH